jgi:glycosyltransferase involved in cell wall biosynthesis
MRIAQVAPPFESVPPARYGGTERVVSTLTEELVRRGHDVTLFASGDSRTSARLVSTVGQALWHQTPRPKDFAPYWAITLGHLWEHIEEFDVVHSHLDYFAYPMARAAVRPVLTTLHGRLDLPEHQPLYRHFRDVPLVSISDAQRRRSRTQIGWRQFTTVSSWASSRLIRRWVAMWPFSDASRAIRVWTRPSERHVGRACRY